MKDKRNSDKVGADMFMQLAQNAQAVNLFAGLGLQNEQILLERFTHLSGEEEKQRHIEELTR